MTSQETDKISAALVAAQASIEAARKEHKVKAGAVQYTYADLAETIRVAKDALGKHSLGFFQTVRSEGESAYLVTRIVHASGQWIDSAVPLPGWGKAQELGSALTYARRYGLSAALGIATEDDDGQSAQAAPSRLDAFRARFAAAKTLDALGALTIDVEHARTELQPDDYSKIMSAIKKRVEDLKPGAQQ